MGDQEDPMAITAVTTVRARPGGYQRVLDGMRELKTIVEKQGLQPRLMRPATGENRGDVSLATEFENWAAFGAASDKIQKAADYRALMKRAAENKDPAIESMSTQIYTDVE